MTTYVLKCIDKEGGLDNYLVNTKDKKIDSKFGSWLKEQVHLLPFPRFRDALSHAAFCPAVAGAAWPCLAGVPCS